jgi:hypothetical protein
MKNLMFLFFLNLINLTHSQNRISESNNMKVILKEISIKAIELGDCNFDFTKEQLDSSWIGYKPTSRSEIEQIEKKLQISLPKDYVDFLLITNGFHAANGVESSLSAVNNIDYLKNVDPELYEIWIETGNLEVGNKLKTAIKIGGFNEEQYFFLIPPCLENPNWEYWQFATWIPGETVYNSLIEYLESVLETTNRFVEDKKNKPSNK